MPPVATNPVSPALPPDWKYIAKGADGQPLVEEQEDKDYKAGLYTRLQTAKRQRDQIYEEFDNQTYIQRYLENRRKANSIIPPTKNDGDVKITSGTLEQKLDAVLSAVNNLNLAPEVHAFDDENNKIELAGHALEDIMEQVAEYDDDEEKKLLRQKEMMIQGEVFVEEKWVQYFKKKKNYTGTVGKFKDQTWTERLEKFYEGPTRIVKYGPNIYMGDITQFDFDQQPYFFEVYADGYENLKSIFGEWEMWQYVPRKFTPIANVIDSPVQPTTGASQANTIDYRWLLTTQQVDECEVIVYQDKWNDEFNIIINGIMMLPRAFPLSTFSPNGEYTVVKQVFKVANAHFGYGRGFIQTAQHSAKLLDEMLRLAVMKTRRSFQPPWINTTKRTISPRVLQAGQITMGVSPEALVQIGDLSEGVTASEFQMIKQQQDLIDKMTVSPQFAGQQGKSGTTATEVMELQRQAKMTLGLVVFACTQLERKCGYLRLWNILENWMKPIDKITTSQQSPEGETSTVSQNKYRGVSRPSDIPGEGRGMRQTILQDGTLPNSKEIRMSEFKDQNTLGYPVKKIIINPEDLKNACKNWYIVVSPQEKETSSFNKAMFREKLNDAIILTKFGSQVNPAALEDEFSRVWEDDSTDMFKKVPLGQPVQTTNPGGPTGGGSNTPGVPTDMNIPTT